MSIPFSEGPPVNLPSRTSSRRPRGPGPAAVGALAAAALLGTLATPDAARAQVCLGSPTAEGQFAVTGSGTLSSNDRKDFGFGLEANLPGPLAFRAGVNFDEHGDDRVARYGGRGSYDVRSNGISVCPVAGADYSRRTSGDQTSTLIRIPVGVSVGGRIALSEGGPALIPSVRAGLAHRRFSGGGLGEGQTETDNSLFAIAGGSVSLNEFFVRGEAGIESADDVDPYYTLTVGIRF